MQSPCIKDVSEVCFSNCYPKPFHSLPEAESSTKNKLTSQYDFITATSSSIQTNSSFTNHESLPSMEESFLNLNGAYPQFSSTDLAQKIRTQEYYHLTFKNHVCLDYIGHGLFSYSQLHGNHSELPSTSSSLPPIQSSSLPLFNISYKNVNLTSQLLYLDRADKEFEFESLMRQRIMNFMNISEDDYSMVFTANQSSAFNLLADSYPFNYNHNLLTVYDFENEAIEAMIESSKKKGAQIISAEFSWPTLRIHSRKLRKKIVSKGKKRNRGLFVFPLQSRMTGARYSYLWMSLAQEHGWHVVLDASALGAKDMETLGLSLFKPDFLVCSFYKIFGDNPSGFSCLFIKKSVVSVLNKHSTNIGIVSLVLFKPFEQFSSTDEESLQQMARMELKNISSTNSGSSIGEIIETDQTHDEPSASTSREIECRGLDHADTLGLITISTRARCLINWFINALMCLRYPNSANAYNVRPLVKVYGPKIKFNRGPSMAFNVYDWKGEKIDPKLVQKLADRNNISINYGFLKHLWFSDVYEEEKKKTLEYKEGKGRSKLDGGVCVITVSIGLLTNFEDMYRVWAFISRFLDADYVEKERWRYMALNQSTVEV